MIVRLKITRRYAKPLMVDVEVEEQETRAKSEELAKLTWCRSYLNRETNTYNPQTYQQAKALIPNINIVVVKN